MDLFTAPLVFIALPLYGWWIIRATRSWDRLAKVVNENRVNLGFLSFKGKTGAFLLMSDIRFVHWLLRRRYRNIDVPLVVIQALDDARRDYVPVTSVMALIVLAGFAIPLSGRA